MLSARLHTGKPPTARRRHAPAPGAPSAAPASHDVGVIRSERHDGFSVITIDRPERANALDTEHCLGLHEAVQEAEAHGDRAAVITGVGSVFSAGADFGGVSADGFAEAHRNMLLHLAACPIPLVAAVNGHAIGAGMQVAISCDLRVVSEGATFAIPTARLGLAVDPWTIERLAALVGGGPARRILMTCDRVPADDPSIVGLVDRRGDLDDAVALAADLATMAPLTLSYIKRAVTAAGSGSDADRDAAHAAFDRIWASSDASEGLRSRREKRAPDFKGE